MTVMKEGTAEGTIMEDAEDENGETPTSPIITRVTKSPSVPLAKVLFVTSISKIEPFSWPLHEDDHLVVLACGEVYEENREMFLWKVIVVECCPWK